MMEIGGRRSRMSNALSAKERDLKHAEHKRYYARTAFKYERRRWTVDEDKLVLIHRIPDRRAFTNHQALDEVHLEPSLAFAQGGI